MPVLRFEVEVEPRPKKRPKVYRWSTVNPSEKDEQELARAVSSLENCPEKPLSGQIRVQFKFYVNPPKSTPKWKIPFMESGHIRPNKSPDLDNYVKLALDALNGVLWEDDRYIVEMHSAKFYTMDNQKIQIVMEQIDVPKYKADSDKIAKKYDDIDTLDNFFDMEDPAED